MVADVIDAGGRFNTQDKAQKPNNILGMHEYQPNSNRWTYQREYAYYPYGSGPASQRDRYRTPWDHNWQGYRFGGPSDMYYDFHGRR
jgi:hypothetical protein